MRRHKHGTHYRRLRCSSQKGFHHHQLMPCRLPTYQFCLAGPVPKMQSCSLQRNTVLRNENAHSRVMRPKLSDDCGEPAAICNDLSDISTAVEPDETEEVSRTNSERETIDARPARGTHDYLIAMGQNLISSLIGDTSCCGKRADEPSQWYHWLLHRIELSLWAWQQCRRSACQVSNWIRTLVHHPQ